MSNVRGKAWNQITLAAVGWQWWRVRPPWPPPLGIAIAFGVALIAWGTVNAQDGAPEHEQEADYCLVSLGAERETLRIGDAVRVWVWGVGVQPDSWNLQIHGPGAVALRGGGAVDSWAELIEWTVIGQAEGEVAFSASMTCREPGNGDDSLMLTVLPAESETTPTPQLAADFCTAHLSLSDRQVEVGDGFYAWFVGAGAEPRSWNLAMEGSGSAKVVGTRELDPQYVEWELETVSPGTLRLTGEMKCPQQGAATGSGEVMIAEEAGQFEAVQIRRIWTTRTVATIEGALLVVALGILAVLVYLLVRRRQ